MAAEAERPAVDTTPMEGSRVLLEQPACFFVTVQRVIFEKRRHCPAASARPLGGRLRQLIADAPLATLEKVVAHGVLALGDPLNPKAHRPPA